MQSFDKEIYSEFKYIVECEVVDGLRFHRRGKEEQFGNKTLYF